MQGKQSRQEDGSSVDFPSLIVSANSFLEKHAKMFRAFYNRLIFHLRDVLCNVALLKLIRESFD